MTPHSVSERFNDQGAHPGVCCCGAAMTTWEQAGSIHDKICTANPHHSLDGECFSLRWHDVFAQQLTPCAWQRAFAADAANA